MNTPKNIGASVRQKLLNYSQTNGVNYNFLLLRYASERFLYRLGRSPHGERFVLKGAALYAVWQSESDSMPSRPTRDVDFWTAGAPEAELIVATLREVLEQPVEDDGMRFDANSIVGENRRVNEEYPGCKIEMDATLDGARLRVSIDFGFGDAITPRRAWSNIQRFWKFRPRPAYGFTRAKPSSPKSSRRW